jgi:hypothetical protein
MKIPQHIPDEKEDMLMCHQQKNTRLGLRGTTSFASSNTKSWYWVGDLLSQRKGRAGNHQDSSKEEVGVSPQEVAQEDLDRSVEEDFGEDMLDMKSKLLEGLQSRRDQYIHSIRGVSSDTLEITLQCRGDVIFIEEKGIDGESAHM